MKLTKLSLAAIIAVGAFSSFASATPLEEAIKGVEVSGFARLRYYYDDELAVRDRSAGKDESIRVSGLLNLTAPVADSLTFSTSISTDGYNYPDTDKSGPTEPKFDKYFFQYAPAGFVLKGGKFEIPAPWTESGFGGSRGNGVLALVTSVPEWTFAAAAYLQTNGLDALDAIQGIANVGYNGAQNLYAVAAIGKAGPVGIQLWAANLEQVIEYTVFGEVNFALSGFNGRVQANALQLDEGGIVTDADLFIFGGLEGGFKNEQFFVNIGATLTNDPKGKVNGAKQELPVSAYTLDQDADGFIKFGKQLYYKTTNKPDTLVAGIKGGFTVDKFGGELGVAYADDGRIDENELEVYGVVSYKYAKNFGVELHYSVLDGDAYTENNELRFQAQYNF